MSLLLFNSPFSSNDWLIREPYREASNGKAGAHDLSKAPVSPLMPLDLFETDSSYQVVADLPGVAETDIELVVEGNSIIMSAERKQQEEQSSEADKAHCLERSFGSVTRRVILPKNADMSNARTKFVNGVLTVTIPKLAEVTPRKLEINCA